MSAGPSYLRGRTIVLEQRQPIEIGNKSDVRTRRRGLQLLLPTRAFKQIPLVDSELHTPGRSLPEARLLDLYSGCVAYRQDKRKLRLRPG